MKVDLHASPAGLSPHRKLPPMTINHTLAFTGYRKNKFFPLPASRFYSSFLHLRHLQPLQSPCFSICFAIVLTSDYDSSSLCGAVADDPGKTVSHLLTLTPLYKSALSREATSRSGFQRVRLLWSGTLI